MKGPKITANTFIYTYVMGCILELFIAKSECLLPNNLERWMKLQFICKQILTCKHFYFPQKKVKKKVKNITV